MAHNQLMAGDREVMIDRTFILLDDEAATVTVWLNDLELNLSLTFTSKSSMDLGRLDWIFQGGTLKITCDGWKSSLGTMTRPMKLGDVGGKPFGIALAQTYNEGMNLVTLVVYFGGTYG